MAAPEGNQFAIGNSGLSKKWESASELQIDINNYFTECDSRVVEVYVKSAQEIQEINKPIPYTIEGLCEVLDCERHTLLNYEKKEGYEEFFTTIKKAKLKIQRNKLERGLDGDSNPAVSIFDLKNNHGYSDKVEVESRNVNLNAELTEEEKKVELDKIKKGLDELNDY